MALNIGIIALEVYFPHTYVCQRELEAYDGVSSGKYTIGLGQEEMGFFTDREDVNSVCLTVVHRLMKTYKISYGSIGFLEVATETLIDKSKSVKSVLMELFKTENNANVEGVDVKHACFGGSAALLNALTWLESSYWDGRYALVVCGDIAVYEEGNARPTGGAGAVAVLLGRDAPLVFDVGCRFAHMEHQWDFYKPRLASEYPVVNGTLSIRCFQYALQACYYGYCQLAERHKLNSSSEPFTINNVDALLFHSPFCKLVQKSVGRLVLMDAHRIVDHCMHATANCSTETSLCNSNSNGYIQINGTVEELSKINLEESIGDRTVEQRLLKLTQKEFDTKASSCLLLARRVGNMYTPSIFAALLCWLLQYSKCDQNNICGRRVLVFSYGSGLASAMYSLHVPLVNQMTTQQRERLAVLLHYASAIPDRLQSRLKVEPDEFVHILKAREAYCADIMHLPSFTQHDLNYVDDDVFYLQQIDENFKRSYKLLQKDSAVHNY